jgi:hypothetical protein
MQQLPRSVGLTVVTAVLVVVLASFAIPGCVDQNQDNSPISVNNTPGRPMLSVTCSQDGSVAYVTDGRNVYRYDRNAAGTGESWECILSHGRRLEMAAKHDPREQPLLDSSQEKIADPKSGESGSESQGK